MSSPHKGPAGENWKRHRPWMVLRSKKQREFEKERDIRDEEAIIEMRKRKQGEKESERVGESTHVREMS